MVKFTDLKPITKMLASETCKKCGGYGKLTTQIDETMFLICLDCGNKMREIITERRQRGKKYI